MINEFTLAEKKTCKRYLDYMSISLELNIKSKFLSSFTTEEIRHVIKHSKDFLQNKDNSQRPPFTKFCNTITGTLAELFICKLCNLTFEDFKSMQSKDVRHYDLIINDKKIEVKFMNPKYDKNYWKVANRSYVKDENRTNGIYYRPKYVWEESEGGWDYMFMVSADENGFIFKYIVPWEKYRYNGLMSGSSDKTRNGIEEKYKNLPEPSRTWALEREYQKYMVPGSVCYSPSIFCLEDMCFAQKLTLDSAPVSHK